MKKVAFITTINTNIGDDFIRKGIENLLESIRNPDSISYNYVNKHFPETALAKNSPLHLINRLPEIRGKRRLINFYYRYLHDSFTILRSQDLIIQSGAPVLYPDCHKSEWAQPLWYDTIGKLFNEIPVLNLAAGSCYPWENQSGFTDENEAAFAKQIGSFCKITTTREKLANRLFSEVGVDNTLLPCTAFFVDKNFENNNQGQYILINYMEGGGHFEWNQNIETGLWKETIRSVIAELSKKHEIRFICHSDKEVEQSTKLFPGIKIHLPKNIEDYFECARYAKAGINNRMHATMAMASLGIPAISVGTDTRLLMPDHIGLPIFYVKDANYEKLIDKMNSLIDNLASEKSRLFELKRTAFSSYKELLHPYVS